MLDMVLNTPMFKESTEKSIGFSFFVMLPKFHEFALIDRS